MYPGILTKLVTLHYIVPDLEGSQALPACLILDITMSGPYQQHRKAPSLPPGQSRRQCQPDQAPGGSCSHTTFRPSLGMDPSCGQWLLCEPGHQVSHVLYSMYLIKLTVLPVVFTASTPSACLRPSKKPRLETSPARNRLQIIRFLLRDGGVRLPGERSSRGDLASLVTTMARLRPTA